MQKAYEMSRETNSDYASNGNWIHGIWMQRVARLDLRAKQEGGLLAFWKKMQSNEYAAAMQTFLTVLSSINAKMINLQDNTNQDIGPYFHLFNFFQEFDEEMDCNISFGKTDQYLLRFKEERKPFFSILSRQDAVQFSKQFSEMTGNSILWALQYVPEHMQMLRDYTSDYTRHDPENTQWVWAVFHSRLGSNAPMRVLHVDT
eukprot:2204629-Rhodomonas_salina.1